MKILIANYRYFISGGPERYMFNVSDALSECSHAVIPFSIQYTQNHSTPYSRYFVKPLGGKDEIYFRQQKLTPQVIWATLSRLFYARDVRQAITLLARDTRPQLAYVLHYLRKLSPSLLVGLKKAHIPVIVRLSDYAMLCPQAHCLRNEKTCELCAGGNIWPSIKHRCVQGSLAASILNFLATRYHRAMKYFDLIDKFVVTTRFMQQKMLKAGYTEDRLCYIPTFVDNTVFQPETREERKGYIAYAGRLTHIKGVHVLIEAFDVLLKKRPDINLTLRIAGDGDEQYAADLNQQVQRLNLKNSIVFGGEQNIGQMVDLLKKAYLSVVPSLWYENLPNALLESYACGTPVLASNLGSLTECVDEGETGYLFEPGNAVHLAERLAFCFDHPELVSEMGYKARKIAETTYSPEMHLKRLENLFAELVGKS